MKTVQQQFNEVFQSDYSKGVRDCLEGRPANNDNPEYNRGYGDQYFLEAMRDARSDKETV